MRILLYTSKHAELDPRIEQKFAASLSRQHCVYVENTRYRYLYIIRGGVRRDLDFALIEHKRFDVVQMNDPLDFVVPALKHEMGLASCTYVLDFHENIAEQILHKHYLGPFKPFIAFGAKCVLRLLKRSSIRKIAATETIANTVAADVVIKNTSLISHGGDDNCLDANRINYISPEYGQLAEIEKADINFIYLGRVTGDRGARLMARLVELFPTSKLHIFGTIKSGDAAVEELLDKKNVHLHGFFNSQDLQIMIAQLDNSLGLCLLKPLPNYLDSFPTKVCDYIALGLPVLMTDIAKWREIFGNANMTYCEHIAADSELRSAVLTATSTRQVPIRQEFLWLKSDEPQLLHFYRSLESSHEI